MYEEHKCDCNATMKPVNASIGYSSDIPFDRLASFYTPMRANASMISRSIRSAIGCSTANFTSSAFA